MSVIEILYNKIILYIHLAYISQGTNILVVLGSIGLTKLYIFSMIYTHLLTLFICNENSSFLV